MKITTSSETAFHKRNLLRFESSEHQITLFRAQELSPLLIQTAQTGRRPFIHPILAPDGRGVLTQNQPPHHPWQHGLYVGLNDVNGIGFWTENDTDGTFQPDPLDNPVIAGNKASWRVRSTWLKPKGGELLRETQFWAFEDRGETYALDLAWTLQSTERIRFGEYPYGGLFLRMPFRHDVGATVLNSEGLTDLNAEAQRARWLAVSMPLDGRSQELLEAGMALLDHPANPEHPTPWRVDGDRGVSPSRCIAGEWFLEPGDKVNYHFRILVFCGCIQPALIEQEWNDLASSPQQK